MARPHPTLRARLIAVIAMTVFLFTWTVEPGAFHAEVAGRPIASPTTLKAPRVSPTPGIRMLGYEEMRVVTGIARRVESMMSVFEAAHSIILPQGLRDPDGRLGLFIVCSRPLVPLVETRGMDARKQWVLLAVFAITKHTEGSPVSIDYIGFTDPSGVEGGQRWFFRLDMSVARQVQHQLFSRAITMEQAYDKVSAAWHRVGPKD